MTARESGLLAPNMLGGRNSSLFSREAFQDELAKKRHGNRSVVSMAHQPDTDPATKTRPKVLYENTYKLEPPRKFRSSEAKAVIERILKEHLEKEQYDASRSAYTAKLLSQIIKDEVKELNYERYKIAVVTSVGQLQDQGMVTASRCVWDTNLDTSASASFKNKTLFAVATVFAVYLE